MHLILQSAGEGHSVRRFARLARHVIYRLLRSRPGKPRGLHFSFLEAAGGGTAGRGGTEEQAAGSTSSGGNRHKGWVGAIPGSRSAAPVRCNPPWPPTARGKPGKYLNSTSVERQEHSPGGQPSANPSREPGSFPGLRPPRIPAAPRRELCGPGSPRGSPVPAQPRTHHTGNLGAENPLYFKACKRILRRIERGFDLSFFPNSNKKKKLLK